LSGEKCSEYIPIAYSVTLFLKLYTVLLTGPVENVPYLLQHDC